MSVLNVQGSKVFFTLGLGTFNVVGNISEVSGPVIGHTKDGGFMAAQSVRGNVEAVGYCEDFKACFRCKAKLQQVLHCLNFVFSTPHLSLFLAFNFV